MHPPIENLITRDAIHRSVYADKEIFDLEMERIFEKTWVFIGHSEEIREAGVTTRRPDISVGTPLLFPDWLMVA